MDGSGRMSYPGDHTQYWYNPLLDYKIYMFSGILVIIVTLIGMLLTALNLVREKEMGTTEQINVTPIRKYQFIMAKLIPLWIIALFELAFGLVYGKAAVRTAHGGQPGTAFPFYLCLPCWWCWGSAFFSPPSPIPSSS